MKILIAGFQHETNTFAPSLADWAAFNSGASFPGLVRGAAMQAQLSGINLPISGFMQAALERGWQLLPSAWAGAIPSSYVTRDAFERMSAEIMRDVHAGGFDAIYLDLHGAAVAEHVDDCEGELIARIRQVVGADCPIVASLDSHANVSAQMLREFDALSAYRTYPHIDMAATGARACALLALRLQTGKRLHTASQRIPFIIPITAQCTLIEPAQGLYALLAELERSTGVHLEFCPGFPAADFAECGPVVWAHSAVSSEHAQSAAKQLADAVIAAAPLWALAVSDPKEAVASALALAAHSSKPVIIADTQDNPGAGGDSNTTGMLHALLAQGAGKRFPGKVAMGLMFDLDAAQAAHQAGVGAVLELTLGKSIDTGWCGMSDAPVAGRYKVMALCDGTVTLKGPMMTGVTCHLGACARLEIDGIQVIVTSAKKQLLDRELYRFLGVEPETMRLLINKSSVHFRADFQPIVADPSHILVAKAKGPMAADPADLPWRKLRASMYRNPQLYLASLKL